MTGPRLALIALLAIVVKWYLIRQGVGAHAGQVRDERKLDGATIARIVEEHTAGVRACWEHALATHAPDAPTESKIMAVITISPPGTVDRVETHGTPSAYPELAPCLESQIRTWRFPASSETTTAQVPFVFGRQ